MSREEKELNLEELEGVAGGASFNTNANSAANKAVNGAAKAFAMGRFSTAVKGGVTLEPIEINNVLHKPSTRSTSPYGAEEK